MLRLTRPFLFVMLITLGACAADQGPSYDRSTKTAGGLFTVAYLPSPNPIPFAELFELDVIVKDSDQQPVSDATLSLKVTMAAHGHGMQTSPQIAATGDGHYRVSGMKFHMRGEWQLDFTVQRGATTDTASFVENYQ